jgi:putative FmdB family regulatory protein
VAILVRNGPVVSKERDVVPTYEYACSSCGNHFDTVQSFSDPPLEKCEICGGHLRRVFHPAGILFKGSGFYSTDNRRAGSAGNKSKPGEKSERSGEKSERSGEKSERSKSEKSSDSSSNSGSGSSESKKTAEKSA